MTWLIVASLIVIGILFLLLEILVVPGTTIVGLLGVGLLVSGVVMAFISYGTTTGLVTLAASLLLSVAAIAISLKSNTWKSAMLSTSNLGRVNTMEEGIVVAGDEGVTVSRLNPYGKALIKDEYYEVVSRDALVNENTPIVVIKVEGNKIIVKPKI
ncbi:MAG: NfeD family protein [Bacteroidales bacterium]